MEGLLCQWAGCATLWPTDQALYDHLRSTHAVRRAGATQFVCKWSTCSKSLGWMAPNVLAHISTHTDHRPFKCNKCSKTFKTMNVIPLHVCKPGAEKVHPNEKTATNAKTVDAEHHAPTVDAHTDGAPEADKPLRCLWTGCKTVVADASALDAHITEEHIAGEGGSCGWNACSKVYTTPNNFRQHVWQKHLPPGYMPYACEHCPERFATKTLARDHNLKYHPVAAPAPAPAKPAVKTRQHTVPAASAEPAVKKPAKRKAGVAFAEAAVERGAVKKTRVPTSQVAPPVHDASKENPVAGFRAEVEASFKTQADNDIRRLAIQTYQKAAADGLQAMRDLFGAI
ncbi:hypothetical protein EXIGLDRAFT_845585 [Exidia glandulosa HHB12029]|uniref:C2H2-type domain-containing protein n=1 Tax=Exidia glandulosa HHB12029 TaxID=1314781 RepID=A0A165BDF8_EXIGL|nr:hypothetical protein EXIGLDRAFT_845585 [Exidia glandulosa HHB12029]